LEGHCDPKQKESSRYTIQEALRTVSKPRKKKEKKEERGKKVLKEMLVLWFLAFNAECIVK